MLDEFAQNEKQDAETMERMRVGTPRISRFGKNFQIHAGISGILERRKHNTPWPGQTGVIVTKIPPALTLEAMIRSNDFEYFMESKLGNDLFINDPDRANRIHEAAKDGCNGSTHQEIIEDWRDYLDWAADALRLSIGTQGDIEREINLVEDWHKKNGSLDQQGS